MPIKNVFLHLMPSKNYAVIVAGGQGTRMGNAVPKQFLELNGKPVLYHTIKAFREALPDIELILVLPVQQISYAQMILQNFKNGIDITVVSGGATRYHSVQNGLAGIPEDAIVFVHDGVRPLVSKAVIMRCLESATVHGTAIPVIDATDSVRIVEGEHSRPIDRRKLRMVQTPQTFKASILLPAMRQPYQEAFTDEATVVELSGHSLKMVAGDKSNLKITTQDDMTIAAALMWAKEIS